MIRQFSALVIALLLSATGYAAILAEAAPVKPAPPGLSQCKGIERKCGEWKQGDGQKCGRTRQCTTTLCNDNQEIKGSKKETECETAQRLRAPSSPPSMRPSAPPTQKSPGASP